MSAPTLKWLIWVCFFALAAQNLFSGFSESEERANAELGGALKHQGRTKISFFKSGNMTYFLVRSQKNDLENIYSAHKKKIERDESIPLLLGDSNIKNLLNIYDEVKTSEQFKHFWLGVYSVFQKKSVGKIKFMGLISLNNLPEPEDDSAEILINIHAKINTITFGSDLLKAICKHIFHPRLHGKVFFLLTPNNTFELSNYPLDTIKITVPFKAKIARQQVIDAGFFPCNVTGAHKTNFHYPNCRKIRLR